MSGNILPSSAKKLHREVLQQVFSRVLAVVDLRSVAAIFVDVL
jgi:hypothetical protein